MTEQTVFDVGDPITSKITLGVPPDGTTNVSIDVYRPDGTAIADPAISAFGGVGGDEKTAQFYATVDGTSSGATTAGVADGDWVVVWKVTGTGAAVAAKVYNVRPLPGSSLRPTWVPFLSEVADHVGRMTIDEVTPGNEIPLGTFNGLTTPNDAQAQRLTDAAAALISGRLPGMAVSVYPLARAVTALRAAASIARSFGRTTEDRDLAEALDRRADAEMLALIEAQGEVAAPGTPDALVPQYAFPVPVAWGDDYL